MLQRLRGNNQKGFTLIELMIVIAIIGILAAIAIPNFMNYQCNANQREGNAVLNAIRTSIETYYAENNVYPADSSELTVEIRSSDLYDIDDWTVTTNTHDISVQAELRQGTSTWRLEDGEMDLEDDGCVDD